MNEEVADVVVEVATSKEVDVGVKEMESSTEYILCHNRYNPSHGYKNCTLIQNRRHHNLHHFSNSNRWSTTSKEVEEIMVVC